MTPIRGFLARSLQSSLVGCSFVAVAACGTMEPLHPGDEAPPADTPLGILVEGALQPVPAPSGTAEARIAASLDRLDRLEVFSVDALFETATQHQWIPYGGFWSEYEVELTEDQQAERLEMLASRAELAVASVGTLEDSMSADDGSIVGALCFPATEESFCLTTAMLQSDLAAINELEIVAVADIVRADAEVTGACYSSWETVGAEDCLSAYRLHAVVEATRDLAPITPTDAPEGEG